MKNKLPLFSALALILITLSSTEILAEGGPLGFGPRILTQDMETDRPDITEGTSTITNGHYQIEAGYTFTYSEQNQSSVRTHALPELLLRVGLLEDLELRLGWQGYNHQSASGDNSDIDGVSDTSIGFKHKMYEESPLHPSLSFIFETSLPTGGNEFGTDELQPSFKLLWSYGFKSSLRVSSNLNFDFPVENNERFYSQGVSFAISYGPDRVGYYAEYFGQFPSSEAPESSANHLLNGGLTYAVNENFQLDARVGVGLDSQTPDFITGVGFAVRR